MAPSDTGLLEWLPALRDSTVAGRENRVNRKTLMTGVSQAVQSSTRDEKDVGPLPANRPRL
ncbi:hypothetical protein ACRE_003770 [Hapsidospora chrysogenum ATCC 11550]|uniref:Uncharacterized protein n=1 Tax=Hapsidospora chrysogenum (strain ATCC 11550 / CBS 779.69 / DSM 880 / IAM 14645 / JCM 23072 / IMI 49137) TaxID=857340 RepID=A0A086THB4_HAPC1|nr:hypothetical protein ACRE_003770 [Hapsidospora chrysogenum ATCC 11550]